MASAKDVAAFFVNYGEKSGELMTNLRVNKLLFFAQGIHLARKGVPLFPEEIEAWRERKNDSILRENIKKLDCFITKKNKEIKDLFAQVNELSAQKTKVEPDTLSNIEIEANVLSKNVELQIANPNTLPAFAENEALNDKFNDFNKTYAKVMKKIENLRQEPPSEPPTDWKVVIGLAIAALFVVGIFSMQILSQLKVKRQQRRQQEEANREMRCRELDNMDQPVEDI